MNSATIVAYTFASDIFCPNCVSVAVLENYGAAGAESERQPNAMNGNTDWLASTEHNLNVMAEAINVDRSDEDAFDSDDFPKVVFADYAETDDCCAGCGSEIL